MFVLSLLVNLLDLLNCISIQALLSAPNPDDPLSENIAKHWKTNEAEAVETGNSSYLYTLELNIIKKK